MDYKKANTDVINFAIKSFNWKNACNGKDINSQVINRKLNDPLTSSNTYWSIMKTFFNGKKVPVIPPLLFNGPFVTDFKEKANIFNSFFLQSNVH